MTDIESTAVITVITVLDRAEHITGPRILNNGNYNVVSYYFIIVVSGGCAHLRIVFMPINHLINAYNDILYRIVGSEAARLRSYFFIYLLIYSLYISSIWILENRRRCFLG